MNEEQITSLQNRLQRRRQNLEVTSGTWFLPKLQRLWHFLTNKSFLVPILEELRVNRKGYDAGIQIYVHVTAPAGVAGIRQPIDSLTTDEDMAALAYHVIRGVCEKNWDMLQIRQKIWPTHPTGSLDFDDYKTFKHEIVFSLLDYLVERLDEQQAILGLLSRYRARCEWFNRRELLKTAQDEQARKGDGKKQAEAEKVLKEDLYRYLHDQGMEFTIEPPSDRGEIDLILDQKGGNRKYIEAKVFDNGRRDAKYIVKGFGQLLQYLRQYDAPNGYLLVYKTCEEQLVIEGAEQLGTIPFVRSEGKIVFILLTDICQYQKPVSKQDYKPIRITADELRKAEPSD